MKEGLLIIDVQNDYFTGGKCELYQSEKVLNAIKELIKYFRENNLPFFYIQHFGQENSSFFVPNTDGVNIHEEIKPLPDEKVIPKNYPNSFLKTDLQDELKKEGITDLVICGMMTHMCVDTTTRAASDYGYKVTLISDACATKDLEWDGIKIPADVVQNVYMSSLNSTFADVVTNEEFFNKKN